MSNNLISIIVPAYNIGSYISRTLDSILAQTYNNIEVIVVDDGSTDDTAKIIDEYAKQDNRIRIIHKPNGGVTSARLCGINASSGDWVGFVDGDDFIDPIMYEVLLSNAIKYKADISHCGYKMVLPSGNFRYYYNTKIIKEQDNQTGLIDLLSGSIIEPGLCNKLFSKSLVWHFIQKYSMDTNIKNNEDLLMNYYLFSLAAKSIYEDICPYCYMVRKNSAANQTLNVHQLVDPLIVRKVLYNETIGNINVHRIAANQLVHNLIHLTSMSIKPNKKMIKPIRKNARSELRSKLPSIIFDSKYTTKTKIMSLWNCTLPSTYRLVHKLYEKASGLDKIYE